MYVPPLSSLLAALGTDRAAFESKDTIEIPKEMLRMLLQIAMASSDFNEQTYLADNPDIAHAVASGKIDDARHHYISHGYFEYRTGGTPAVDEHWYLNTYPDVAATVRRGGLPTAKAHFDSAGATEGRSPSLAYVHVGQQWKHALRKAA